MLYDYIDKKTEVAWNKIAVKDQHKTISYKSLDAMSSQVSNMLFYLGIKHGDRVGLLCRKSVETIVSIYGILKNGSAYIPIDFHGPVERPSFIIKDCGINTLFADDKGLDHLLSNPDLYIQVKNVIYWGSREIEDISKENIHFRFIHYDNLDEYSTEFKTYEAHPDDMAYILYTSGSTGKPKGVILTHRNGKVYVDWAVDHLRLNEDDIFSSHAPFTFDLSIFDIFGAHKAGGILCLPPEGFSFFVNSVTQYIQENEITVWYSVPSILIQLLINVPTLKNCLKSIKTLIFAGEVFPFKYLNQLSEIFSGSQLINFYGPTETNVITHFSIDLPANLKENVPIGEPCPYADIKIVDESGMEVNPGEKGELVVQGDSLMEGYWNNSDQTAKVIRTLSLKTKGKKQKYYFTGDIVFKNEDDSIFYVGRKDRMIKTRGFRVELGDIENVLSGWSGVETVLVIPKPDMKVSNRLFAFVVMEQGAKLEDFEDYANESLPAYMIPETFIPLDKLPLTANGKINRLSLEKRIS